MARVVRAILVLYCVIKAHLIVQERGLKFFDKKYNLIKKFWGAVAGIKLDAKRNEGQKFAANGYTVAAVKFLLWSVMAYL